MFIFGGSVIPRLVELQSAQLAILVMCKDAPGIITCYTRWGTLALGVAQREHDVSLPAGPPAKGGVCHPDCIAGSSTHCFKGWIWGRATEAYDGCLEYFGLGPIAQLCWPA